MLVKLDLYRIFYEVSRHQSFSKAARELYMTQPAVSQAIAQLENELGTRVFTRIPRGVTLTQEGNMLFEYVSSSINLINTGEKKLLEMKDLLAGELKIGVGDTISRYFLPPYLEKFHNQYSNIKLKIINRTTMELCMMLKRGDIDIAICNLPIEVPSIEVIKCMDVHDIFVCGIKYKDILPKPISFETLVHYPLILLDYKSNTRKYVEEYILSKGVKISPDIELGSHDLLLEFSRINLGIACVIKEFSLDYLNNNTLYEVQTIYEIPKRAVGLCFLKNVPLPSIGRKFVDIIGANN